MVPKSEREPMQIKYEKRQAGDCDVHSMFLWNGGIWTVVSHGDIDSGDIVAKQIASGWTNNPDNRWQYMDYGETKFNASCEVAYMVYDPTSRNAC